VDSSRPVLLLQIWNLAGPYTVFAGTRTTDGQGTTQEIGIDAVDALPVGRRIVVAHGEDAMKGSIARVSEAWPHNTFRADIGGRSFQQGGQV
jgi:hypothetical protein